MPNQLLCIDKTYLKRVNKTKVNQNCEMLLLFFYNV